jgi:uncharacterized delta-60 repeat protein
MKRIVFALSMALAPLSATIAAEVLDPAARLTFNGIGSYKAIAMLPMPDGGITIVYQFPFLSGVCARAQCVALDRLDANFQLQPGSNIVEPTKIVAVKAAAVDSRGRIVVVGDVQGAGDNGVDFGVARFLSDGSVDPAFDAGDTASVDFHLGQSNNDYPQAVAIDGDDNIVVVGSVQRGSAGDTDFGIARLRADDGSPDTDFNGTGQRAVLFELGPSLRADQANSVAIGNDGGIVVGGLAIDSSISRTRAVMAKLKRDGTYDADFCNVSCNYNAGYNSINNGRRVYYFGSGTIHSDIVNGVDVAGNGDIVIAGETYADDGSTRRSAVARFDATGTQENENIDPGLSGNGSFRSVRFADGDGTRIIVAGESGPGPNFFLVQAFLGDLAVDSSYGNCQTGNSGFCFIGGSGLGDDGPDSAASLTLDARGRPLFAGTFFNNDDAGRGHVLVQRISNNEGPLPDRIFRDGFQ